MRTSLILLLLIGVTWMVAAQQNPFDLNHRLPKSERQSKEKSAANKTPSPKVDTPSPVEKEPESFVTAERQVEKSKGDTSATPVLGDPSITETMQGDRRDYFSSVRSNQVFHFWYFPMLAIFLALVINMDRSSITKLFKSVTNMNYLNLLYRDQRNRYRPQYILFGILAILSAAFFMKHALGFLWDIDISIFKSSLFIGGMYLLRHLFMEVISFAFPGNSEINQYSYSIFIFNIILGIGLLLINLFLAFSPPGIAQFCVYLGILLFALQYAYRSARGLLLSANLIYRNKFRFFMYLCTLEIAPIFLIISIFRQF